MIVLFRAIFWEEIISAAIVISMLMLNDLGSYLKEITELVQKVLFFFCRVKRWVFLNDKHEHSLKTICDRFWIYTIITCPAIMWPRHTAPLSPTFSSLKKKLKDCAVENMFSGIELLNEHFFLGCLKNRVNVSDLNATWSLAELLNLCEAKLSYVSKFLTKLSEMEESDTALDTTWSIENKKILVCRCSKKQSKCL